MRQSLWRNLNDIFLYKSVKNLVFQLGKQECYSFPIDALGVFRCGELFECAQNELVAVYLIVMEPFFMFSR